MNSRCYFRGVVLAVTFFSLSCTPTQAGTVLETSADGRREIHLTVYNNNLAMVREVREAMLPEGPLKLEVLDVPATLLPESVQARSLTDPASFYVWGQSYNQNVADPSSLLEYFVGKKIKVMKWNEYQDRKETLEATLLSTAGGPAYQIGEEIYLDYDGTKILPGLPEGFVLKPALSWDAVSSDARKHEIEMSYLASGFGWHMDYILSLDENGAGDLSAWATITNASGTAFENAHLKLVAGQINQTAPRYPEAKMMMRSGAPMAMDGMIGAPSFQEAALFDYHAYTLSEPVSLADRESRQVAYLKPRAIETEKIYRMESGSYYYGQRYAPDGQRQPVSVYFRLENREDRGLGLALPQGTVRMYLKNAETADFIGEDNIPHLGVSDFRELRAGEAFDVTARRRQIDYRQITTKSFEAEWEVKLQNKKKEETEIQVIESLPAAWEILSESHPSEKISASSVSYRIKVPAKGEAVLTYRVRVGY